MRPYSPSLLPWLPHQARLPLSILVGQTDGSLSLIHSNDLTLPQEEMKGAWEAKCSKAAVLGILLIHPQPLQRKETANSLFLFTTKVEPDRWGAEGRP